MPRAYGMRAKGLRDQLRHTFTAGGLVCALKMSVRVATLLFLLILVAVAVHCAPAVPLASRTIATYHSAYKVG